MRASVTSLTSKLMHMLHKLALSMHSAVAVASAAVSVMTC